MSLLNIKVRLTAITNNFIAINFNAFGANALDDLVVKIALNLE